MKESTTREPMSNGKFGHFLQRRCMPGYKPVACNIRINILEINVKNSLHANRYVKQAARRINNLLLLQHGGQGSRWKEVEEEEEEERMMREKVIQI